MTDPKDLYVMQDGTHATYGEVTLDRLGVLRNKNGVGVAMDADGDPQMVGSDAVRNKNVMEAERAKRAAAEAGVMRDVNAGRRPSDEDGRAAGLQHLPAKAPAPAAKPAATKKLAMPADKTDATDENREVKSGDDGKTYETR